MPAWAGAQPEQGPVPPVRGRVSVERRPERVPNLRARFVVEHGSLLVSAVRGGQVRREPPDLQELWGRRGFRGGIYLLHLRVSARVSCTSRLECMYVGVHFAHPPHRSSSLTLAPSFKVLPATPEASQMRSSLPASDARRALLPLRELQPARPAKQARWPAPGRAPARCARPGRCLPQIDRSVCSAGWALLPLRELPIVHIVRWARWLAPGRAPVRSARPGPCLSQIDRSAPSAMRAHLPLREARPARPARRARWLAPGREHARSARPGPCLSQIDRSAPSARQEPEPSTTRPACPAFQAPSLPREVPTACPARRASGRTRTSRGA